jgi:hypothetical protein
VLSHKKEKFFSLRCSIRSAAGSRAKMLLTYCLARRRTDVLQAALGFVLFLKARLRRALRKILVRSSGEAGFKRY